MQHKHHKEINIEQEYWDQEQLEIVKLYEDIEKSRVKKDDVNYDYYEKFKIPPLYD